MNNSINEPFEKTVESLFRLLNESPDQRMLYSALRDGVLDKHSKLHAVLGLNATCFPAITVVMAVNLLEEAGLITTSGPAHECRGGDNNSLLRVTQRGKEDFLLSKSLNAANSAARFLARRNNCP
jgi:hypothetical protein